MDKWRKVWRLSWSERRLLVGAAFLLPIVAALIRLRGLRGCQSILARLAPVRNNPNLIAHSSGESLARTVARIVRAAAVHGPYKANCLQQSVTLWWLLRRKGLESDLRIGARTGPSGFEAHAWVEFGGLSLNESRDVHSRYTAFDGSINPSEARPS